MEQKKYKVEEFHRGEWIALEGKDQKGKKTGQRIVKITEDTAEVMNMDSAKTKERYVLLEESENIVFDVKDLYKMSKPEQEAKAKELGVEFDEEHSNQEKRANFLKSILEAEVN
jgi:alpha-L-fucosidase